MGILRTAGSILDKTYRYSGLKLATKATSAVLGAGSESFGNITKKEAAFEDFIKSAFSAEKKKESTSPRPTPPGPGGGGIDPETKNNIKKIESNTSTILRTTDDIKFSVEGMQDMMERLTNIAEMQLKAMERMIDEIKKIGGTGDKGGIGKLALGIGAAIGAVFTAFKTGLGGLRTAGELVLKGLSTGIAGIGIAGKVVWDGMTAGLRGIGTLASSIFSGIGNLISKLLPGGSDTPSASPDVPDSPDKKKSSKPSKSGGLLKQAGRGAKALLAGASRVALPVAAVTTAGAAGYAVGTELKEMADESGVTANVLDYFRGSKDSKQLGDMDMSREEIIANYAKRNNITDLKQAEEHMKAAYSSGAPTAPSQSGTIIRDNQPTAQKTNVEPPELISAKTEMIGKPEEESGFFDGMFEGFESFVTGITEYFDEPFAKFSAWMEDIKKSLGKWFKDLPDGIANSIKTMTEAAKYAAVGTYRQMTASPETISKNQAFVEGLRDKDPYMYALAMKESSGGSNLFAKTSSATGSWQFTDATWQDTVKEMGKEYSLEDRLDPEKAYEVAKFFDTKNRSHLQKELGREVSSKDAYMAHFLGRGGATSFLKNYDPNDPNQKGTDLVGAEQAAANKSIFYNEDGSSRTSKEVYASLTNKFSGAEQDYSMVASATKSAPTKTEVVAQQNAMAKNEAASRPVVVSVPSPPQPAPVQPAPSTSVVNNYVSNGGDPMIRLISAESSMARLGVSYGFA